jgi:hypothetical protein
MRFLSRATFHLLWLLPVIAFFIEPALAGNKFETIGGGVTGSSRVKWEYLQIIFYVAGGIFLLLAIVSVTMRNSNVLMLNSVLWKESSIVLIVFSLICFAVAIFG